MKTWIKVGIIFLVLVFGTKAIHDSGWFQRKYVYPYSYQEYIYDSALEWEVDPTLIISVMHSESKFSIHAKSHRGAIGLMQLMPDTALWIATQIGDKSFTLEKLYDPKTNIRYGTWYLASLKREFQGNEVLMLAAYNAGRGNVKKWMEKYGWGFDFADHEQIPFDETRGYVAKVLQNKQAYLTLYED
ncbi:MAG: lytic transglycosylase domain-containing protein [Selenomonadales bacterium]|nr:lytic transglycosylase domain-containing protein [Selenomonadales bacterium]